MKKTMMIHAAPTVLYLILSKVDGLLICPGQQRSRQTNHITFTFSTSSTTNLLPRHKNKAVYAPSRLFQSRDWIDEVRDDELMDGDNNDENATVNIKPDMKYLPRNVMRQFQNFLAIREAGSKELTNDVYMRKPGGSNVFWFVGKIARVTDVTPAQAVSRQWNIIETHACNLRPLEFIPSRGQNEIWIAPGDSEMDVAYSRPEVTFEKMQKQVKGADILKSNLMGFQGEIYEDGEQGFRTWRNEDGTPAKAEISSPSSAAAAGGKQQQDEMRAPTYEEMKEIQKMMQGKDINEVYKEQQRRAGNPVEDDD